MGTSDLHLFLNVLLQSTLGCRAELAEKQLRLIDREKELLDMDQTVSTLREEVSILIQQVAAVWHMVAGCKAFTQCTA